MAVQGDRTGVHIVKAHQQLDHSGLACAGGTYNGYLLAGLHRAAEVVDDGLVRGVAEAHMVKGDLSVNVGRVGAAGGVCQLRFLRLAQKLEHPLCSSSHALQHIGHLRKLLDGLGKVFDVLDKGLNITNGDDPVCSKNAAHDGHRHIA